ncbi:ChaN family lipoprotein [Parapedobacter sp.]
MNIIRAALICSLWVTHIAASHAQIAHSLYTIYDTHKKKEITLQELVTSLAPIDIVFFGEEHNDSIAHVLQFELLKAMDERYDRVALSMEMFVSDDQLVLNEYLAGMITERNLDKDAVLWGNYEDYRPMVEYAKDKGLPLLAANAPGRYTNRVSRSGLESLRVLDKSAKHLLAPLPIDTLTGRYYEKFTGLMGGHGGMGNMKIYQSQNLWDATMAYRISKFFKGKNVRKILHLNGRFHSDEHLGTIAQLDNYIPRRTAVANISCFPDASFSRPDWDTFAHLGDFIILTNPAAPKTF